MAIALHHSRAKGAARLIVIGIANHDGDGGCMVAMSTLAKYGAVHPRNARKHVAQLQALGEIRVHVQGATLPWIDDPELQPNRYDFLLTCPSWCDRTKHHRDTRKGFRGPTKPLWINPRAEAPPGAEAPGGPPGGSAPLTGLTNPVESGSALPTGHASPDAGPPCFTCALPRVRCQSRQAKWRTEDRHEFTPRERPTT